MNYLLYILIALIIADIIFIIYMLLKMKKSEVKVPEYEYHLIRAEVSPDDCKSSKDISKELMKQVIVGIKEYTEIKLEDDKFVCEFLITNVKEKNEEEEPVTEAD